MPAITIDKKRGVLRLEFKGWRKLIAGRKCIEVSLEDLEEIRVVEELRTTPSYIPFYGARRGIAFPGIVMMCIYYDLHCHNFFYYLEGEKGVVFLFRPGSPWNRISVRCMHSEELVNEIIELVGLPE